MESKLVKTGDLGNYIEELKSKNSQIVEDCVKMLPYIKSVTIKSSMEKQKDKATQLLTALEKGYIPVQDTWGFHKTDTKSKWSRKAVNDTLKSMPQEIRDVWEKVKLEGFFDSFSVSVSGGGDPLLVGNKGKSRYLIGAWLHIAAGYNLGFVVKR